MIEAVELLKSLEEDLRIESTCVFALYSSITKKKGP